MIEYLYNAIRATAGNDIAITAEITDADGNNIEDSCYLMLHDKDRKTVLAEVRGKYEDGEWVFIIPATQTKELKGRYWYCIRHVNNSLCFKEPIYFV